MCGVIAVLGLDMCCVQFYHACDMDEWSTYRLCIMPYHVLQYTDFFCSIMSFWVTLMAMAELPFKVKALAHMLAVYAFSMGLTWKQFGILPYAIPISTGALIVVLAWVSGDVLL